MRVLIYTSMGEGGHASNERAGACQHKRAWIYKHEGAEYVSIRELVDTSMRVLVRTSMRKEGGACQHEGAGACQHKGTWICQHEGAEACQHKGACVYQHEGAGTCQHERTGCCMLAEGCWHVSVMELVYTSKRVLVHASLSAPIAGGGGQEGRNCVQHEEHEWKKLGHGTEDSMKKNTSKYCTHKKEKKN